MSALDDAGAKRQALLLELAEVTATVEALAVAEVAAGVPKRQVAERGSVTRPTLDAWLRAAAQQ